MRRFALGFALVAIGGASGCTCGSHGGAASTDGASPAAIVAPDASLAGASSGPLAIFSAPIAGARVDGGDAIVVGLVVPSKAIVAARVDANGAAKWSRTIVDDVAWSADAELHAWPIGAGAAVTWRGPRGGRTAHVRAVVAPDGSIVEAASPIGSLVCATDDGLAWASDDRDGGGARIALRAWSGGAAKDAFGADDGEDLALDCGNHRVVAIARGDESDEGVPTRIVVVGPEGPSAPITLAPSALGKDEERDLWPWATGDDFGLVRVSTGGAVTAVELHGGDATPLHAEHARVDPEDDVVAIDADARELTLVTTHDESDGCPGGRAASSVHALRIPRVASAAGRVAASKLASGACGTDVGPFWTESLGGATLAGWAERAARVDKSKAHAPIAGFAWRVFDDAGRAGHVAIAADAIADAGCDGARCLVVALVRPDGADGMSPEAIRAIAYP